MSEEYRIQPDTLKDLLKNLFLHGNLSEEDAEISSEYMIRTNLWGVDSHGVLRMPIYLKRLLSGAVNPKPDIKILKGEHSPLALMDGDAGLGYIVGKRGMDEALQRAKEFGIGFVLMRNSNHYGAAALYARSAAEEGMIGISTTNVIPNIGMKGNAQPSAGNNPIALAAPLNGPFPFVLDISLSAVAGGKLLLAAKKGEKIPKEWAVTKEGLETDDPVKGFEGFLLPVGLHKGFGLSLFVDIITGVLSGGPFLQDLRSMYKHAEDPSLTTHLFCAVDPGFFIHEGDYKERISEWVDMVHGTPMVDASSKQVIPGELEYQKEQERNKEGIPIPPELMKELRIYAEELNVPFSL